MFYFYSLHVSGIYVPIIRRINCSNSSMITAGSSNGVKNTRCCRYSCMRS